MAKMGRPSHEPTEESKALVAALAGVGVPQEMIAVRIDGMSVDTLSRHYKTELMLGRSLRVEAVANSLYKRAIDGDTTAAIFLLKTQAGFKETNKHEVTGVDGGPVEFTKIERVIVRPEGK